MPGLRRVLLGALVLAVAACSRGPTEQELQAHRVERDRRTARILAAPLAPRVLQAGQHQVVVIDVPVAEFGIVHRQLCFVWRDAEFKTATMSCPADKQFSDFRD